MNNKQNAIQIKSFHHCTLCVIRR